MDNDRLNELESILYASIHYNDTTSEEQQHHAALGADLDAQSMPPPSQQKHHHQQQQHRIVSEKRVINNATAKPRYWAEAKSEAASTVETVKPKTSEVAPVEGQYKYMYIYFYMSECFARAEIFTCVFKHIPNRLGQEISN